MHKHRPERLPQMRRQALIPPMGQCRFIRGGMFSQVTVEHIVHPFVAAQWSIKPLAFVDKAHDPSIEPLRLVLVGRLRGPTDLLSLIAKSYPPSISSLIQSHPSPPFLWPCLVLVSRVPEYRRHVVPGQ